MLGRLAIETPCPGHPGQGVCIAFVGLAAGPDTSVVLGTEYSSACNQGLITTFVHPSFLSQKIS